MREATPGAPVLEADALPLSHLGGTTQGSGYWGKRGPGTAVDRTGWTSAAAAAAAVAAPT